MPNSVESCPSLLGLSSLTDFKYYVKTTKNDGQEIDDRTSNLDAMIKMLRDRFERQCPYLWNGRQTLISLKINDYIEEILNDSRAKSAWKDGINKAPHLYKFAKLVVRNCAIYNRPTCVLLTGHSASGKTKACYEIMNTITSPNENVEDVFRFRLMLLRADLLLQTLGSIQSEQNDNCGCFGKLIELFFDVEGSLRKMAINVFLLDTNPLSSGLCSLGYFKIFYPFVFGNTELFLNQRYGLSEVIRQFSSTGRVAQREVHKDGFRRLVVALKTLNFNEDQCNAIWSTLAAILHLMTMPNQETNISLMGGSTDSGGTFDSTWWIASLLSVPLSNLTGIFEHFTVSKYNSIDGARRAIPQSYVRTYMAKEIYTRLFHWVSQSINKTLEDLVRKSDVSSANTLVLVDIPLLKLSQPNSFNTLCLNFLNEKLHKMYIQQELIETQNIIDAEIEGKWSTTIVKENLNSSLSIVDLFDRPSDGLLNFKLTRNHENDLKLFLEKVRPYGKNADNYFLITHFDKLVNYRFDDVVFDDGGVAIAVDDLMRQSSNKYISDMWSSGNPYRSSRNVAFPRINKVYKDMVLKLSGRDMYYVRCIDPFQSGTQNFDEQSTKSQLSAYNLYEQALLYDSCRIVRSQKLEEFVKRYKLLSAVREQMFCNPVDQSTIHSDALTIAKAYNLENSIFVGKSHALYNDEDSFYLLEENRACDLEYVIIILQSVFRSWYRKRLTIKEEAATVIGRWYRITKIQRYFKNVFEQNPGRRSGSSDLKLELPAVLRRSSEDFRRIFLRWQSLTKLNELPTKTTRAIYLRGIGCSVLRKRANFMSEAFGQFWRGDYLDDATNEMAYVFSKKMESLKSEDNFQTVLFSTNALKMNSRAQEDFRTIVFTEKFVYKLDPNRKYVIKKTRISIKEFAAISVTTGFDQLVVLHSARKHDLVFHMDCEPLGGDRVCELVCVLTALYQSEKIPFTVKVTDVINANFEKETYSINVIPGEKVAFKKNGRAVVLTSPECRK